MQIEWDILPEGLDIECERTGQKLLDEFNGDNR